MAAESTNEGPPQDLLDDLCSLVTPDDAKWMTAFCRFSNEKAQSVLSASDILKHLEESLGRVKLLENFEILLSSINHAEGVGKIQAYRRAQHGITEKDNRFFIGAFRLDGNIPNLVDRREHIERTVRYMLNLSEDQFIWDGVEFGSVVLKYCIPTNLLEKVRHFAESAYMLNIGGAHIAEIMLYVEGEAEVVHPQSIPIHSAFFKAKPLSLVTADQGTKDIDLLTRFLSLTGRDVTITKKQESAMLLIPGKKVISMYCHSKNDRIVKHKLNAVNTKWSVSEEEVNTVHVTFDPSLLPDLQGYEYVYLLPSQALEMADTLMELYLSRIHSRDVSGIATPATELDVQTDMGELEEKLEHLHLELKFSKSSSPQPELVRSRSREGPERVAFLVGPGYGHLPLDQQLQGTANDLKAVRKVLTTKPFNFRKIHILEGNIATHENILKNLKKLVDKVKAGSVFLWYFTGNGIQLADGREGLLPSDDITPEKLQSNESLAITAEDVAPMMKRLAEKGCYVTLIFDCSFSGKDNRGFVYDEDWYPVVQAKQVSLSDLLEANGLPKNALSAEAAGAQNVSWIPPRSENFVVLTASANQEKAYEMLNLTNNRVYSVMTYHMRTALEKMQSATPELITYDALLRLIHREILLKKHIQGPQIEGTSNLMIFGAEQVDNTSNHTICCVEPDHTVNISSGHVHLLRSGLYDVFGPDTPASEQTRDSSAWCGRIDILAKNIKMLSAIGNVIEESEQKPIKEQSICSLVRPRSLRCSLILVIHEATEATRHLETLLKAQELFNVKIIQNFEDEHVPETVVIGLEDLNGNPCWMTRRVGQCIIPPVAPSNPNMATIIAVNAAKATRQHLALQPQLSNKAMMKNVKLAVHCISNVTPYDKNTREERILQGLQTQELYEGLQCEAPQFKSHKVSQENVDGSVILKPVPKSGDALVLQVTNGECFPIHVCVLLYGLDGSVEVVHPQKKGTTVEVQPGNSVEEIFRVYIPDDAINNFDPAESAPSGGRDVLMLYASRQPADYSALLQEGISLEVEKCKGDAVWGPLSPLDSFHAAITPQKDLFADGSTSWLVERREFHVIANRT